MSNFGKQHLSRVHELPCGVCIRCGEEKPIEEFKRRRSGKDATCKVCNCCHKALKAGYDKNYRDNNQEKVSAMKARYVNQNREKVINGKRNHYVKNKNEILLKQKEYYEKSKDRMKDARRIWGQANKERVNAASRRWRENNICQAREVGRRSRQKNKAIRAAGLSRYRATKIKATPSWANHDKIKTFYRAAKHLTELLGRKCQVDHIIPLRGKSVCGLHVETNIRVISAEENQVKGNDFNDDGVYRMTKFESVHIGLVKELNCGLCDASGPSEYHHLLSGRTHGRKAPHLIGIPLCASCHRDNHNGIHGRRAMWDVMRKSELDVLADTIERIYGK